MSSSAASTTHPRDIHDRMARNYFGVPQNMANLLEQTLPAKVCKRLDLSSLEPTGETFITGEYEKYIADLVFTCRTKSGEQGSVYVLFEHKSQPEPTISIQLLNYMLGLWNTTIKNKTFEKTGVIPFVIPVVFYHGKQAWDGKLLRELFCNDSILREISPNFPIFLCSLNDIPWKKLKRKPVENAMIMLLKCHLQKNSADKILEVLIICTSKLWSKKENEKIGDDWNDFISYTEKAHSEIASQAKYNIKEYVMNSNFDAERMKVLKSWFPFLYEDGLTEGKTEARAQTQQGIIQLLQARFGELPQDIESNLKKMEDDSRLSKLIVVAGMATSLEDVAKAIKQN